MAYSKDRSYQGKAPYSNSRISITGNLGAEPKLISGKGKNPCTVFSLAVSFLGKDSRGEDIERTRWHQVKVFGATAQYAADNLRKGDSVHVEGQEWPKEAYENRNGDLIDDEFEIIADSVSLTMYGLQWRDKDGEDSAPRRRSSGEDDAPRRRRSSGDDSAPRRRRSSSDDSAPRRRRSSGDDDAPRRRRNLDSDDFADNSRVSVDDDLADDFLLDDELLD